MSASVLFAQSNPAGSYWVAETWRTAARSSRASRPAPSRRRLARPRTVCGALVARLQSARAGVALRNRLSCRERSAARVAAGYRRSFCCGTAANRRSPSQARGSEAAVSAHNIPSAGEVTGTSRQPEPEAAVAVASVRSFRGDWWPSGTQRARADRKSGYSRGEAQAAKVALSSVSGASCRPSPPTVDERSRAVEAAVKLRQRESVEAPPAATADVVRPRETD
jgi:hypothetical protein